MVGIKKWDAFSIVNYVFLSLFCLLAIYPMIYVLAGSLNDGNDYMRGGVYFFPRQFSLASYKIVFGDERLYTGFTITLLRTVLGTIASVLFTAMVAYAMSRQKLVGRSVYSWIFLFTMFFGGGLIPYFLVLKFLHLLNTFWVFVIPTMFSVFNMIIMQSFFRELPEEMLESASLDGAGDFGMFARLALPLSMPVLATVAMWNGVWHWNEFYDAMLFTNNDKLMTLQLYMMKLIKESDMISANSQFIPPQARRAFSVTTVRMAAIIISTIPILFVYPFMQRYFVTGIMVGSLKG
ncbi:carbohydrate ABC transporter permease [Cohnella sp. 56]|uniref:carbohydrate ABC transporter permease n=1 Tax=Cohnella sp. 56 TaxID=3113722 RepID=UPI0030EA9D2F